MMGDPGPVRPAPHVPASPPPPVPPVSPPGGNVSRNGTSPSSSPVSQFRPAPRHGEAPSAGAGYPNSFRKPGFKRFPPGGQGARPPGVHPAPLVVQGGIKIQGEGRIGRTWWATRWIHVLESFGWTNRMERGRNYARQGQVIDVAVRPGLVTGHVQGAREEPYRVSIRLHVLPDHQWTRGIGRMSRAAMYTAKLFAGEMPDGIERIFAKARCPLFPTQPRHLKTSCSCPDPINPCKHIAALYYILAEEFDRDPFMLFKLRGKDKESFMAELRSSWGQNEAVAADLPEDEMAPLEPEEREEGEAEEEDLPLTEVPVEQFWRLGPQLSDFKAGRVDPPVFQAILKRLGPPPVWKGSQDDFLREMAPVYVEVRKRALAIAWGERKS